MQRKHIRKRLDEERERLLRVREGLDAGDTLEQDEQEKNASLLEQVESELRAVDEALGRLEAGSYGVCMACGRPIAEERLEAMPAARFCVEDQARAEREAGAVGRIH
jgi:DnaK suppressor protein